MRTKARIGNYIGIEKGTSIYYLPISSSLYRTITEGTESDITSSTENIQQSAEVIQTSFQTNNFKTTNKSISLGAAVLDYIARAESEVRENIVLQYVNEIRILIRQDDFVDGEISDSEHYMIDAYNRGQIDYIADALMEIYSSSFGDSHILEGILTMISCIPYEAIAPKGQIMAMGLLTNKNLSVRDKAIQCFEKWNSKKGLDYLKNIECSPAWLQKYVDKVVMYIERDGTE